MVSIGAAAYQNAANLQTNDSRLIRQTVSTPTPGSQPVTAAATPVAKVGDRVSLSPEVEVARLRESLGLQPTGKLRRQDFEAQIKADRERVRQALQTTLATMGVAASDALTLSQDAKGQIQVGGEWSGKEELAKKLNADPEFSKIFTRLAANSGVLDYTDTLKSGGKMATLSDYLDGDSAETNLVTLLQQYDSLKSSPNSLASLIGLSNNGEKPFSLSFDPGGISPVTG